MNQTKFKPSTTLKQMIEELEYNGMTEITRLFQNHDGSFIVEYNIRK